MHMVKQQHTSVYTITIGNCRDRMGSRRLFSGQSKYSAIKANIRTMALQNNKSNPSFVDSGTDADGA